MTDKILTYEQEHALEEILSWYNNCDRGSFKTLGGYAGTGKSFLISKLKEELPKRTRITFCAPTGRAASSLKKKLIENDSYNNEFCSTIHSLIYWPDVDPVTNIIKGWVLKPSKDIDCDLIIIDEASMISSEIWEDLRNFRIPILAVGDHGQLYPVSSDKFSLMKNPDLKLNTILRQAQNNPIIGLSMGVRHNGFIATGTHGKSVFKVSWRDKRTRDLFDSIKFDDDTISLCGRNNTRNIINHMVRENLGYTLSAPYPGEKIVCLSNNHKLGIMNGELFTVMWLIPYDKNLYEIIMKKEGENNLYSVFVLKSGFGHPDPSKIFDEVRELNEKYKLSGKKSRDLKSQGISIFDYGNCITVHKSQGSEWNRVVLFEERNSYQDDEEWKRWLYTGVTRSKDRLFIIDKFN